MEVEGYELPDDLYYDDWGAYMWAKVEGDVITFGITSVGVAVAKDIVYMELPFEGDDVTQKEAFGMIETVKATGELLGLVSGTVAEVSEEMGSDPSSVKDAPYEKWLIKVKPSNLEADLKNLLDVKKAVDYYKKEIEKLKAEEVL